jgi:hypothetical protein
MTIERRHMSERRTIEAYNRAASADYGHTSQGALALAHHNVQRTICQQRSGRGRDEGESWVLLSD